MLSVITWKQDFNVLLRCPHCSVHSFPHDCHRLFSIPKYTHILASCIWCACTHIVIVVYSLSHVWLFVTPWTIAHQIPLSMGFPRQEYWSGLPFPSPGDLPDPGVKLASPALQADSLPLSHLGSPHTCFKYVFFIYSPHNQTFILFWMPVIFLQPRNFPRISKLFL